MTLLRRRNELGKEEPDDADLVKDFGLTSKINEKPLKNFQHRWVSCTLNKSVLPEGD